MLGIDVVDELIPAFQQVEEYSKDCPFWGGRLVSLDLCSPMGPSGYLVTVLQN